MSCFTHWKSTLSTVDPTPGGVGERRRDRQEKSLIEKRAPEWRHLHEADKKEFPTIAGFSHHDSNPTPEPCSGGSGYKNPLPHRTMLQMDLELERLDTIRKMPHAHSNAIQVGLHKRICQSISLAANNTQHYEGRPTQRDSKVSGCKDAKRGESLPLGHPIAESLGHF